MKITREKAIGISSAVMIAFVVSLLFMIMGSPLASAVPPVTQVQAFTEGYVIEGTPQEFIKQNTAFQYNFFVYNISNGKAVTSSAVECAFYLATDNGTVTAFENATYFPDTRRWGVTINENNFSSVGHHPFGVKCNSTIYGGAKVSYFTVTPSGGDESLTIFLVAIIFAVSLLLIAFILKNYIFSFISGAAFIVAGIYAMIFGFGNVANDYTRMIAVVIIGIGLITSIISALDLLGDVSGEGDDDYVYEEE